MASTRSKRWNGNFDSLPTDFLKGVMEKMAAYGDRVQFSLISGGPPAYQLVNSLDKTMAFDKNHHLMRPENEEFTGPNATRMFTLDEVKAAISGVGLRTAGSTRTARVVRSGSGGSPRTTTAMLNDQYAAQRYEYFKNNRQSLPPTIAQYSDEITELMKNGKPVEQAFEEVIKKHF